MTTNTNGTTNIKPSQPPRLQTSFQNRPRTATNPVTPTALTARNRTNTPPQPHGTSTSRPLTSTASETHQRFVLTDPLAFRYLEDDPSTKVLTHRATLTGYESYIVEQWSTSRSHPTFTITTYTGDPAHSVVVGVILVPTDEATWSPRLRVYFKALNQYHARRRETELGVLMVTSLSGFPSTLTVVAVPDGDLRRHRVDFFVNEDLKRLGCSGRVGLTLVQPAAATVAKFHQLYRTSDKNDIYGSVIELVKLCQSALMLFDKLEIDYADGLLCDVTERAVNDWWLEIGSSHYNTSPHDGILGPTTVAALLGLLMGARNRLHAVGAPVGKDAFDVEAMKRGIGTFQKQQRLQRTRRLDRRTLDRLHKATVKAANSDAAWTVVPKAVKSTVAELSGKGGEMVMDHLGRRDKAGIAEIETCDMERFVQLVYGERGKWLWYGKVRKHRKSDVAKEREGSGAIGDLVGRDEDATALGGRELQFKEGESGGYTWTARKSVGNALGGFGGKGGPYEDSGSPVEQEGEEDSGFRGAIKRTSGFKEAKSGLGRFKGAVGLGSGNHKHTASASKDGSPQTPMSPRSPDYEPRSPVVDEKSPRQSKEQYRQRPSVSKRAQSSPGSHLGSPGSPASDQRDFGAETIPEQVAAPRYAASYEEAPPTMSKESLQRPPSYMSKEGQQNDNGDNAASVTDSVTIDIPSVAGSVYEGVNLDEVLPTGPETEHDVERLMRRTVSFSRVIEINVQSKSDDAYPRHLSFSLAEESVLTWEDIAPSERDMYSDTKEAQMLDEEFIAEESKYLRSLITDLQTTTAPFAQHHLSTLSALVTHLDDQQVQIENLHSQPSEHLHGLHTNAESLLRAEKEHLEEMGKEIETLAAKLEYEINGLKGRVEDVEAGVGDFGRGVGRVEDRVGELEKDAKRAEERRWGDCVVM